MPLPQSLLLCAPPTILPNICPYKVILFLIIYSINLLIVKMLKQMGTGDIVLADQGIFIQGGERGGGGVKKFRLHPTNS